MSNQDDKIKIVELQRVNDELTQGLERCRFLLQDCRAKLVANNNEPVSEDQKTKA